MIPTPEQLEFTAMVEALHLQSAAAEMQTKARRRKAVEAVSPEHFAVLLLRAVTEENVSFPTYGVMMAVTRSASPPSLAGIAMEMGYSYHAVHKMLERTMYFEKFHTDLTRLRLTLDGEIKLARISKRVARYA